MKKVPIVISTLGDLADSGMGLRWACNDCSRDLELTLVRAIERWGRDQNYVGWRAPVKCTACRSRNISVRVVADTVIPMASGTPFVPS